MEIVQRARSFPILFSTLVIGLSPLVPVPVVDDLITAALCRWRVKYLAGRYGLGLKKEEIKILADEQQIGCFSRVTGRAFSYILREIWENALPWLEVGRALDLLTRTYYYGILLDCAFYEGLYQGGNLAEARRLSNAIYDVRKGANFRQLRTLLQASGKGTWKLAGSFMKDLSERYFKNILRFKRHPRQLVKQREQVTEQADQDTEGLNEAAPGWAEKYKPLFEEFGRDLTNVPAEELERLCGALHAKMNPALPGS